VATKTIELDPSVAATVYCGPAIVREIGPVSVTLQLPDREARAELALAYPYRPQLNDMVLALGTADGDLYIVGVLRGKGTTRLCVDGDLEIETTGSEPEACLVFTRKLDSSGNVKYEDSERIANSIIERFEKAEVDAVYLFSNEFKSVMMPVLAQTRVLPIEVPETAAQVEYIYEQPPAELLGSLLPRYVKLLIYRAFLESVAAEHAARMTAMEAASSNASDVIDKLTLVMNRVRQASITREIIEIVSGAAALD